jgi:hypothetical protein
MRKKLKKDPFLFNYVDHIDVNTGIISGIQGGEGPHSRETTKRNS